MPFPPVLESSLDDRMKASIIEVLRQDQVDVGILCSKCKALKINGCVVGSFEGRYHANSHVLANIGTTV